MQHYARTELTRSTADVIEGRGLFDGGRYGLFLAGPRRTGKTTFLRRDLAREMQRRGHTVVYVDLWSDTDRDPAKLIDEAVGNAIVERLGAVAKATLAAGVESLDFGGIMKIDTMRIGEHDGAILDRVLAAPTATRLFDAESLAECTATMRRADPDAKGVTASRVQKALARLRKSDPPLLWKSNRGEYAVADPRLCEWRDELHSRGRWPPRTDAAG